MLSTQRLSKDRENKIVMRQNLDEKVGDTSK